MNDDNTPPNDPANTPDPDLPPTEPVIVPASDLPPTDPTAVMPVAAAAPLPNDPNTAIPNDQPDPRWYENRAAVGAIIAVGLLGIFLLIAWLLWWSDDDDDDLVLESTTTALIVEGDTASTVDSSSSLPPATIVEGVTASTIEVTLPESTTTSTTTTTTTTTTTVAPTTTEAVTTTSTAPATTIPVVTVPPSPAATIFDVIANSPDLSRLNQLIVDAGLQDELGGDGPITLFAPSNPAIETLESAPGGAELLANPDQLRALLLRHVTSEALDAATIFSRTELATASGETLVIDGANQTVDGASLLVRDVEAANGFLQVVDQVLISN